MSEKAGLRILIEDEAKVSRIIKILEDIEKAVAELRDILVQGASSTVEPSEAQKGLKVDLQRIDWRTQAREKAEPSESWAWAYIHDQEGKVKPETRELFEYLKQHGEVTVDGYEITVSKDKFLNRKLVKS